MILLEVYMYPKCGVERLKYENILSEYSSKCGKEALIINPPKECPIKLILKKINYEMIKLFTFLTKMRDNYHR